MTLSGRLTGLCRRARAAPPQRRCYPPHEIFRIRGPRRFTRHSRFRGSKAPPAIRDLSPGPEVLLLFRLAELLLQRVALLRRGGDSGEFPEHLGETLAKFLVECVVLGDEIAEGFVLLQRILDRRYKKPERPEVHTEVLLADRPAARPHAVAIVDEHGSSAHLHVSAPHGGQVVQVP